MQYKIISVHYGDSNSRKGLWERDTQVGIEIGEDIPTRIVPYWPQVIIALRATMKINAYCFKIRPSANVPTESSQRQKARGLRDFEMPQLRRCPQELEAS